MDADETVSERATHDYRRAGASRLYAALDLTTGKVIGRPRARHRAIEFKRVLQTLNREVPDDLAARLMLDDSSTRKTPAIHNGYSPAPASACTSPQPQARG